jgi:hypothetical protein
MLSFWRNALGPYVSPLIQFAALIVPGASLIVLSMGAGWNGSERRSAARQRTGEVFMPLATMAVGALTVAWATQRLFVDYPIDVSKPRGSDILLMITVMARRFVHGEFPYAIISTSDYSFPPSYMPLQWLPFVGAELVAIDYRWVPFAVLTAAILAYEIKLSRSTAPALTKWALAAVPFALWLVFLAYDPASCGLTVEPLIAGYYLILSLTILGSSGGLQALSLIVCLVSRYSVVLWVPLFLWIVWMRNARGALLIGALVVGGVLLFYGPFLLHDPGIYTRTYRYYTVATLVEWTPAFQPEGAKPYHLFQGVGFAVYFYDFLGGRLERRVAILQSVHLAASLLCILALGILFLRVRERVDEASCCLASLSLYLAVFYAFIQIPYTYLFLTPLFVSCAVVYAAMTLSPSQLARAGGAG